MSLQAQDITVRGTVLDQTGKAIERATVIVKNESAKLIRSASTNGEGLFEVTGLTAGVYIVEASASGFAPTTHSGVQLASGNSPELSISLRVASTSTSVTVEEVVSLASQLAPSVNTLDPTSAKTQLTTQFIDNFTSPPAYF